MQMNETQLIQVRKALLEDGSDDLIQLVFHLNLRLGTQEVSGQAIEKAAALRWIEGEQSLRLTLLGQLVADSIREYWFWIQRARRLHSAHASEFLAPKYYEGKSFLEVGSGFGSNLLSLAKQVEGRFVGVEPTTIYRQMAPILAEREGLPSPRILEGSGENLPFPDAEFDIVFCYSSHQYMDVKRAIAEMVRVLKPGGQLQIEGATLGQFSRLAISNLLRRPGLSEVRATGLTIANTLAYEMFGRRILAPKSVFATAAPIYPSLRMMKKWLRDQGLLVDQSSGQQIGTNTLFLANKPIGHGMSAA